MICVAYLKVIFVIKRPAQARRHRQRGGAIKGKHKRKTKKFKTIVLLSHHRIVVDVVAGFVHSFFFVLLYFDSVLSVSFGKHKIGTQRHCENREKKLMKKKLVENYLI